MNEPLRPLTLGEILDRTAQLYRARFLLFLGISVIPTGVVVALACLVGLVVAWWSAAGAGSVSEAAGYILVAIFCIAVALVALPVYLAATALAMAAMSHAVSLVHLGQTTTIRDAYKTVWGRGWRYIWLYFLEGLIIGAAPIAVWTILVILFAGAAALTRMAGMESIAGGVLFGLVVILVVIALIGYVLWMLLRLSLAFPACVVEQIGAWIAIKRSSLLSIGTKGRIFVLFLLGAALSWLLSMGITLPLTIILSLIFSSGDPQHAQAAGLVLLFIAYGVGFAVQALIRPVYGIALVLFYFDQRIRKEGFDIEWMMQQAGMVAAPTPTLQTAPWLPPTPEINIAPVFQPPQDVEFPQASKPSSPESGESQ
ncbi:MAG: hypothetical protein ABR990_07895 [Terracidiphilus sp.]|jgi:hypothetical protein